MDRDDFGHLALAVILIAIAGYVDAVGFLKLGHLFVSFMSGDSTQFAVAGSQGSWTKAGTAGSLVVLFVAGVIAGRCIAIRMKVWHRPIVLLVDALLLAFAATVPLPDMLATVPMVIAMGVQNAAVHKAGGIKTSITYVTGTLVSLGEKVTDAFATNAERWAWAPYLLLWIGLVLGAVAGAAIYPALHLHALLVPAWLLIVLAAISIEAVRRARK